MNGLHSTLRWGGLAGAAGSVLLLVVFGIVAVFVGMEPLSAEEAVTRFPEIRAARTAENALYLGVLVLWVLHFLALRRALQPATPARALFGSGLGVLGVALLAAGALPHVAAAPISDRYHAPGTTPEEQAALVLVWQATQGVFDALLVAGLAVVTLGIVALGTAMLGAPGFGKGIGGTTVGLGGGGLAAAAALLVDVSPIGMAGVLALVVFHIVVGWRTHRLSGATHSAMAADGRPRSASLAAR